MLLLESQLFEGWDIRVFGTDISTTVIRKARAGIYSPISFRSTRPDMVRRFFSETDKGMRVNEDVRAICHFTKANLLDKDQLFLVGQADVIFCRNVLIYFDKKSKMEAISLFYDRLKHGGYLLLGHTESLINLSTAFELAHLSEDLVYRKPEVSHAKRR
jgi:chemotaxis protein methyltransferase CheR